MNTLMTSEQMIEKAGLNWRVRQAPVLFEGNGLSTFHEKVVNFREDNGAALGIVSPSYQIVQNSTAFAFLDTFLGAEIESYVKASSWRGGARISLRVKLPGEIVFANNPDDKGDKVVDFYTSHDGSIALEASILAWRLVCSNGLKAFKRVAGARAKHTLNLSLDAMKESLGLLNAEFNIMQSLSNKMAEQPFRRDVLPNVLMKIGLISKDDNKVSSRAQGIIDEISLLFDGHGKGSTMKGSANTVWGAYNAITEYVDHYRGKGEDKRLESSTIGSGAVIKERALELLSA